MTVKIQKDIVLAELTTLKIGGRARFFAEATSEAQIAEALDFAKKNNLETFILGGGSNILISDRGFGGLVLQVAVRGISTFRETGEIVKVTAGAGEDWDAFCGFCAENDLQGVECLSGIPGFVGGTPVQNVGAYGQEVAETITAGRCFDRKAEKFVELSNAECEFAYRSSLFNTTRKNRYVVAAVTYRLKIGGKPKIAYRDLQNYFGDAPPTLIETREAVLKIRAEKSMIVRADDPNSRSAGSFFKNPIVSREKFAEVENRAAAFGIETVPFYIVDEKSVKIPAAWLIENSGFQKGYQSGRAGISTAHTLAIVNCGGANARDVLNLKTEIQSKVKEKFRVKLQPEPIFVGFEDENFDF